jgi:hypothetical protein
MPAVSCIWYLGAMTGRAQSPASPAPRSKVLDGEGEKRLVAIPLSSQSKIVPSQKLPIPRTNLMNTKIIKHCLAALAAVFLMADARATAAVISGRVFYRVTPPVKTPLARPLFF